MHSDEDVRIWSETGWYKMVLHALNVPYTYTSNPLCERRNLAVTQNLRILMKQERTKNWVPLLPWVRQPKQVHIYTGVVRKMD